jgi:uncharacterized membrane protein
MPKHCLINRTSILKYWLVYKTILCYYCLMDKTYFIKFNILQFFVLTKKKSGDMDYD